MKVFCYLNTVLADLRGRSGLGQFVNSSAARELVRGAVAPGRTRTAMDDEMLADETMRPAIESFPIPVGEPGSAEEIGGFVAFLLSDQARFFCGSVLFQDGGTDALLRARDWPVGPRPSESS